jgi:dTDP-4-amino-4,6-dideoxy-D-galactose acyltransferase
MTIDNLIKFKNRLNYSNNYNFIKDTERENLFNETVLESAYEIINSEDCEVEKIVSNDFEHLFILKKQIWESKYFGFPCFSIEFILFNHNDYLALRNAINLFVKSNLPQNSYCTINVPSEDTVLIQALSSTGFNMIETRLNYVLKLTEPIISNNIGLIKKAENADIPSLRLVAKKMRNCFDRVHADPTFDTQVADEYIATFAEEAIKGFADIVLKVEDKEKGAFGFLAANYPINISGINVSKLVLAAIDSSVQKGKLVDLLSEMIFLLKLKNTDYLTTITQAPNIPAIKTWEKGGFNLFKVTHLYSNKNG